MTGYLEISKRYLVLVVRLFTVCCFGRRKASSYHTTGTCSYSYLLPRTRKSGITSNDCLSEKIWKGRYLVRVVYSHFAAYWPRPCYIGAICFLNIVQDCYPHLFFVSVLMKRGQREFAKRCWSGKAETGLHGLPMWFLWLRRII